MIADIGTWIRCDTTTDGMNKESTCEEIFSQKDDACENISHEKMMHVRIFF